MAGCAEEKTEQRSRQCLRLFGRIMKYRANLRRFSLERIEEILRYSSERYFDNGTHRMVVVGKHDSRIVIIPYDKDDDAMSR